MAMEQKERELLTTFFKNNEDLIRAAINALGDEELSKSMAKLERKSRSKNTYNINGKGCYSMYEVLEKFVEFRLADTSVSVQDIDKEIAKFIHSERVNVSDTQGRLVFKKVRSLMAHSPLMIVKSDILSNGVTVAAILHSPDSVRVSATNIPMTLR